MRELRTIRQPRLLRLPPHLADLPIFDRRGPAVRVADFELFERSAERFAQLEIGFRAKANRRHAKVPPTRPKGIGDLGECMHLGPPLCDPAYDAIGLAAATLLGDPRGNDPIVSITQDSRPRVPVRGRHSSSWDEKSDKGEVAVATSNRHFALAHEIGKQIVSIAGNAATFVTSIAPAAKLDTSLTKQTTTHENHQSATTNPPVGSRISLSASPALPNCRLQAVSRPILTSTAARPILPPSPDQVDAGRIRGPSPASQPLNTAGTTRVVSETHTSDTRRHAASRPVAGRTIARIGSRNPADYCHRTQVIVDRKQRANPTRRQSPARLARAVRLTSLQPVEDMHERQLVARKIIWKGDAPVADVGCVLTLAFASQTNRQFIGRTNQTAFPLPNHSQATTRARRRVD
jgi:hypothetical protein